MTTHAIREDKGLWWRQKTRSRLEMCWNKAALVAKRDGSTNVPQAKEQVKQDEVETHWDTLSAPSKNYFKSQKSESHENTFCLLLQF